MTKDAARNNLRSATAVVAVAGLLVGPSAAPASATGTAAPSLTITGVAVDGQSGTLAVTVRYQCAPGMLSQVVGTYGSRSFDWVAADELYGQEESRVFDVPCTGTDATTTVKLVTTGRVPRHVHVHAGIGVSDPSDWSFRVANASGRFRV